MFFDEPHTWQLEITLLLFHITHVLLIIHFFTHQLIYQSINYLSILPLIFYSINLLSISQWLDKVIKLWKITERCRRFQNLNTVTDEGHLRDSNSITSLRVPRKVDDDLSIEAMPRRVFSNAHTYHINSISVNSDDCTYLSADDLRVNIWHLETTEQSFSILLSTI